MSGALVEARPASSVIPSAAGDTNDGNEAYADWPGEYLPVRLPWPLQPA